MNVRDEVAVLFDRFRRGTESCLLAQRLVATVPEAMPASELATRREMLFGTPMQSGGQCHKLLNLLDETLYLHLQDKTDD